MALWAIPSDVLLMIGGLGGLLAYCLMRLKQRGLGPIETAAQHAEAGQLQAATELLVSLSRAKGSMSLRAQAALAHLHLRRGHLGHAVSMFASLTARSSGVGRDLRCSAEHALAYLFAVGGDLERAEHHWSVTARLREPISPLGCLLLCKRGRFDELVGLMTRPRLVPKTDTTVAPVFDWHGERVVALLCAFAYVQDPCQSATSECRANELLEAARPTYAGEYDYLQANWPELRNFVEGQRARLRVKRSHHVRASILRASVVQRSMEERRLPAE